MQRCFKFFKTHKASRKQQESWIPSKDLQVRVHTVYHMFVSVAHNQQRSTRTTLHAPRAPRTTHHAPTLTTHHAPIHTAPHHTPRIPTSTCPHQQPHVHHHPYQQPHVPHASRTTTTISSVLSLTPFVHSPVSPLVLFSRLFLCFLNYTQFNSPPSPMWLQCPIILFILSRSHNHQQTMLQVNSN